jgi:hypothetical protein
MNACTGAGRGRARGSVAHGTVGWSIMGAILEQGEPL